MIRVKLQHYLQYYCLLFENLVNYDKSKTNIETLRAGAEFENLVNYDKSKTCIWQEWRICWFENLVNYDKSKTSINSPSSLHCLRTL